MLKSAKILEWKNVATVTRKGTILVIVQSLETGLAFNVATAPKVSRMNPKVNYDLADRGIVGHGRGRCKEPLKEEAQDEDGRPEVNPLKALASDAGEKEAEFERKPVAATSDANW